MLVRQSRAFARDASAEIPRICACGNLAQLCGINHIARATPYYLVRIPSTCCKEKGGDKGLFRNFEANKQLGFFVLRGSQTWPPWGSLDQNPWSPAGLRRFRKGRQGTASASASLLFVLYIFYGNSDQQAQGCD